MNAAYRLQYYMHQWYIDFLQHNVCDDILIMQNELVTAAYERYLRMQLSAACFEFSVGRNDQLLNALDLKTAVDEGWNEIKVKSCNELITQIIAKQKEIIAMTNNYPLQRTENLCRLPPNVQASEKYNDPQMINNNTYQLIYLNRAIADLQQTTFNSYFIGGERIMSSTPITEFVKNAPFEYNMGVRLDRIPGRGEDRMLLLYDLVLTSDKQSFKLSNDQAIFEQKFLKNFLDLTNEFFHRLERSTQKAPDRTRRLPSISSTISESSVDALDFYQMNTLLDFREQSKTLYIDNMALYSNLDRNASNIFAIRVIQTTCICLMERYSPEKMDTFLKNPVFHAQYELISSFINAIYSRLVAAYARGDLKSTINLRYIRKRELGNGKISRQIRKLNNVLIFGPLLYEKTN